MALAATLAALTMLIVPALALGDGPPPTSKPAATPANTGAPSLTGTPVLGQTLTCAPGTWSGNPNSFSYAWLRDGVVIAGQTGSTYVVQAADQGHSISCQVTASNGGGEYAIVGLPSGSYKVSFYPLEGNYVSQYFNGQASYVTANPVTVTAPNATPNVNAEMHPGGQIAGKVSSATTHAGLANVDVCASAEIAKEQFAENCALANSAGEYTIVGLPSGTYTVSFSDYVCNGITCGQQEYLNTSKGGVAVAAPNPTTGVDVELQLGGKIAGTVTPLGSSNGIAGAEVCAISSTNEYSCAFTNSSGQYAIMGLQSDEYTVFFSAEGNYLQQYYKDQSTSAAATHVKVEAPETVSSINGELQEGGQISGQVKSATTHTGLGEIEVCAFGETIAKEFAGNCTQTKSGGEYTIPGLPSGIYNVTFYSSGGYVGQPYGSNPVTVAAPATIKEINAELNEGGKIAGKVTGADTHAALAGHEVCADKEGGSSGGCTYTNAAGEYTIIGLESGSFKVYFYAYTCNAESCALQNYLDTSKTGVPVTAPTTTAGVDAELQPAAEITGRVTDATTHAGLANVDVCAYGEIAHEEFFDDCTATSTTASASATAKSNALSVHGLNPTLTGKPKFNAKTGDLVFTFDFPTAGKLSWSLFFKNADVGFADSLGISLNEGGAVAETARKKHKHKKKCKKGDKKHKGKCVRVLVPFSSGSENVPAGTVKVSVHASGKALKALRSGHTLHVSGTFTFQSSLGGKPTKLSVTTVVHPTKKKKKKGKHGKHGGKH